MLLPTWHPLVGRPTNSKPRKHLRIAMNEPGRAYLAFHSIFFRHESAGGSLSLFSLTKCILGQRAEIAPGKPTKQTAQAVIRYGGPAGGRALRCHCHGWDGLRIRPTREGRPQDVLMGFWPAISSKVPLHFGHWMMCDARRISSCG